MWRGGGASGWTAVQAKGAVVGECRSVRGTASRCTLHGRDGEAGADEAGGPTGPQDGAFGVTGDEQQVLSCPLQRHQVGAATWRPAARRLGPQSLKTLAKSLQAETGRARCPRRDASRPFHVPCLLRGVPARPASLLSFPALRRGPCVIWVLAAEEEEDKKEGGGNGCLGGASAIRGGKRAVRGRGRQANYFRGYTPCSQEGGEGRIILKSLLLACSMFLSL